MKREVKQDERTGKQVPLWVNAPIRDALKIKASARGITLNELVKELVTKPEDSK